MGIVNVTPDSFSDGGQFANPDAAIAHALELERQGADILDVGGESTRPGAEPVSADEELRPRSAGRRGSGAQTKVPLSSTPPRPQVARACLTAGAHIVNDVTGLADAAMVARGRCRRRRRHRHAHAGYAGDDAARAALRRRRR